MKRSKLTKIEGEAILTAAGNGAIEVLSPRVALLAKLGSIVVHIDEASSDGGHHFDWLAIKSLLADREVQDWIMAMGKQGFVPVKRS